MSIILGSVYKCDALGCEVVRLKVQQDWIAVATDRQGGLHVYPWPVAEGAGVLPYAAHYCGPGHAATAISAVLGANMEAAKIAEGGK